MPVAISSDQIAQVRRGLRTIHYFPEASPDITCHHCTPRQHPSIPLGGYTVDEGKLGMQDPLSSDLQSWMSSGHQEDIIHKERPIIYFAYDMFCMGE